MPSPHTPRTRKPSYSAEDAIAHLTAADARLGRLIAAAGPFNLRLPAAALSPFESLAESIIYQQLHGKAAATIHRRLLESFHAFTGLTAHGLPAHFTPQQLLDCPNDQLRAAGLSANKALALRDLAAKSLPAPATDGAQGASASDPPLVPTLARIRRMSDDAVIDHLTQVRGIGRWTVEMFLMFRLGRPDILPTTDFAIRRGFALTFQGLKPTTKLTPALLAKPVDIERRARRWQPFRSVASWYLYRACDLANQAVRKPAK